MRSTLELKTKEIFRILALNTREKYGITQSEMSRALFMSERSYEEIERGKSGCGVLTVILLLIKSDDPLKVLNNLEKEFKKAYNGKVYEHV